MAAEVPLFHPGIQSIITLDYVSNQPLEHTKNKGISSAELEKNCCSFKELISIWVRKYTANVTMSLMEPWYQTALGYVYVKVKLPR